MLSASTTPCCLFIKNLSGVWYILVYAQVYYNHYAFLWINNVSGNW